MTTLARPGCYDRPPFREVRWVQQGWKYGSDGLPKPRCIPILHRMSIDCQYSRHYDSPGCAGCRWQQEKVTE